MSVQHARLINLRAIVVQLRREGMPSHEEQAAHLGEVTEAELTKMVLGRVPITDGFATHVEWVMYRRKGWMDELHLDDPLDA